MTKSESPRIIAFTIEALTVGGAERMLLAMATEFATLGWQVHVVCLTEAGELAAELDERISLHILKKGAGINAGLLTRLYRCIRDINPLCVNSHLCVANTWTRAALLFSRYRVVATEHSRDSWKPWYYRKIDWLLAKRTAALVAVSGDTADFYREEIGVDDALIRVINNGVDTMLYANGSGERLHAEWSAPHEASHTAGKTVIVLGTVGRFVTAKNHPRLIDALKLLSDDADLQDYVVRLVMAGDGPEKAAVIDYVKAHSLEHSVIFTGTRHDIPDVLAAFDVFVLSSDREGHPLTALEAQSAGTPVVLTDAGGSSEAIARQGDQCGGVLVGKSASALAEALKAMIVDADLRQQRAEFARTFALANFDKRQMVERYGMLFEGVAS